MSTENLTGETRKTQRATVCPMCAKSEITTSWDSHAFFYGSGESAVNLTVNIPVRRCEFCEFGYLDEEAEQLKHEAVCEHLGVLSPSEIRRIREGHGMTRARFAQVTGLGEASLNRWENGLTIQTHANDRYLRLLSRPAIMRQLNDLVECETPFLTTVVRLEDRFRAIEINDSLLMEKDHFQLRRAA